MKGNLRARASLTLALLAAGLLLALVRPAALGIQLYQVTPTLGLPTRPGLTRSPTMAPTATVSPTVAPPLTVTPLLPTTRPTGEPPPTAAPSTLPPTPEPTPPPAVLPTTGVVQPAGYWIALLGGLALLAAAVLLRRRQ